MEALREAFQWVHTRVVKKDKTGMTDQRTPKEINEAIALLRGWRKETEEECKELGWKNPHYMRGWFNPIGEWQHRPPDYFGKWKHAEPLLEEVPSRYNKRLDYEYMLAEIFLSCWTDRMAKPEAISRAWLAWKEEK